MKYTFSRSIFWPLVLIAIGTLWLLGNYGVISDSNLWVLLRFWPVLLIALGLDLIVRSRWPIAGNLIALATVALAVVAVIFAPRLGLVVPGGGWFGPLPFMWSNAPGSGHVVTETRPVNDFDAVSFEAFGELTIAQGEAESLTIEAEDNVLSHIRAEVRGGTLHIGFDNVFAINPTRPVRFKLVVKRLTRLELSGAGSVTATGLETDQLEVSLSGAGSLKLENLTADAVNYDLSGAGSVEASGKASRLDAHLAGFGSYAGENFQSATADINLSGTGSATVWVTGRLDATISGLGSVEYYGQPTVSQNVSGLGNVRRLGDK
jgi:hypothetical protein